MKSDFRIRYLLDDPYNEKVCLNDVIMAFASTSEMLSKLEYKNTAHALREAKKAVKKAKLKMIEFELRLRNEVTEEVTKELSKIDKRVDPKNPENNKQFFGE
jgi:hypothetical protein